MADGRPFRRGGRLAHVNRFPEHPSTTNRRYPTMKSAEQATPLDALWQASVIIWVVLAGEGLAAILALAPGVSGSRWVYFGLGSLTVQWISLLVLGGLFLCRNALMRLRPQYVAYFALLLLVVSTWIVCGLGWWLLRDLWAVTQTDLPTVFARLTGVAVTVGLLGLAAFQNHWRVRQLAVRSKQSELEALQARIRPHFLFNTLNTGAALVHQRPEATEQLLLDLADLFRAALAGPDRIPLIEELALTQRYLEIEGLRFGDRLQVEWDVPAEIPAAELPTLSIQPLVENAIRHGIEPCTGGGQLSIRVQAHAAKIRVEISNTLPPNGVGSSRGHQVGLQSVRARLMAMGPGENTLETRIQDGRFIAVLELIGDRRPGS